MIELEKIVELLPREKKFFDFIQGQSFPWFFQNSTYNFSMHCHTFMKRNEAQPYSRGIVNSEHCMVAEAIFNRICEDNGVKVKTIYRLAVNSTTAAAHLKGDLHVDQGAMKHRVFLMYLNEFSEGPTYIYLGKNYEPDVIEAAPNKVVIFDGEVHAQGFCKVGERRLVFVATFNAREE